MTHGRHQSILDAFAHGEAPATDAVNQRDLDDSFIDVALSTAAGRRWLRQLDDLSEPLADRLITHHEDFQTPRRDRSLERVVQRASADAIVTERTILAGSSAASAFWERVAGSGMDLAGVASEVMESVDARAAENTLYLLVLDPIDPFGVDEGQRVAIARAGLSSPDTTVRSLAAEYLFDHAPERLAAVAVDLVQDEDERVRGLGWSAAVRFDPAQALEFASRTLNDTALPLPVRRSALAAIGSNFATADVVEVLEEYVLAPEKELAVDAGNLLYRLHRHPAIAMAAARSPFQEVREIGEFLLDPYRGSPAAGGSRPGDPTSSEIFAEMIRQTEERAFVDDENKP